MSFEERLGKCFTFIWKVENFSFCLQKQGKRLKSPAFVVNAIDSTKWTLCLYPRGNVDGNTIAYFLNREADSKGPERVVIKFDLAFLTRDGSVLLPRSILRRGFPKNEDFGYNKFLEQKDVYISSRAEFLPKNVLTVRCRMWKNEGVMTENVRCCALTRIGVEKISFMWSIENFNNLELEQKRTFYIKSIENDAPLMSINLSLTGGLSSKEIIRFDLALQDKTIKFCTLSLFIINALRNKIECNVEEIWFNDTTHCKQFTCSKTKKELLERKSMYLPNDTLTLLWEWAFSKGVVYEKIEETLYNCSTYEEDISIFNKNSKISLSTANIKSLYDEKFLSDVKLKTFTSEFPAHKFILSAASSVFKAMFSHNMKENCSDCVEILDLDDDTLSRMLLFIYSSRLEDLTWERASQLYVAANKYAIFNLKSLCSSFLKENLSPNNACRILLLADLHVDSDLKSAVQDYILINGKQISKSDEWKALMITHVDLAAETMSLLFK